MHSTGLLGLRPLASNSRAALSQSGICAALASCARELQQSSLWRGQAAILTTSAAVPSPGPQTATLSQTTAVSQPAADANSRTAFSTAAVSDYVPLQGTWPHLTQAAAATTPPVLEPAACGLKFDDPRLAFAAHSNAQLLRGAAVFSLCSVKPLVARAESGLRLAKRVFGKPVVNAAVRHTFFKHFCAGEDGQTIKPTLAFLHSNGIGALVGYSAESDVAADEAALPGAHADACTDECEAALDCHMRRFMTSIDAAAEASGQSLAAIKVTALARPELLERVSEVVDPQLRSADGVDLTALTDAERARLRNLLARLTTLAEAAEQTDVRLLIDAEHSYFQPAIDYAALQLMRRFNGSRVPVVYNTYQCYRKDTESRLLADLDWAKREGICFGAKLVRGAYIVIENERAAAQGYPSPIHDTIQDTHASYDRCVDIMLAEVAAGEGAEVIVASHNQASVERTVGRMSALGLCPASECGVFFGQLLGMADHLTFTLGRSGYRAYKYVPFGPVDEVMPFLIRRAQENSDVLGSVGRELRMLRGELARRVLAPLPRPFAAAA